MAHVSGRIRIQAPIEAVFDVVADVRNEPSFNPAMRDVALLTPEPVTAGSRFLAHLGARRTALQIELTEHSRPFRLGSRTASSLMETTGGLTFTGDADATVMRWDWEIRPRGLLRVLGPLVGPLGARMERRIWGGLRTLLEERAAGGSGRSLDVELEDVGGTSWWAGVLTTLSGQSGTAQLRFVARDDSGHRWTSATFAAPRTFGTVAPQEPWAPGMTACLTEIRRELEDDGWTLESTGDRPWQLHGRR